ncbi:unannotated protein [freshwater metagenome]|uniref:peptidoglycan glycosyltransferase n=1 Tax=freshwater metagenome TaxID=449393 RepID=A0A6J6GWX4_9ZZZZ|nr:hypothetical protein [Actinomycetota bacterium]
MSDTSSTKRPVTLKDRREATLRRTGVAKRYREVSERPPSVFYSILIIVSAFVLLGLVMVLSSSSVVSLHSGTSAWNLFIRQCFWASIGAFAAWTAYRTPYETWRNYKILMPIVALTFGLNVIVFLKGSLTNGAKAWLDIGPFRMQPSEFMKIAVILFCANLLSHRHRSIRIVSIVLAPLLALLGLAALLCAMQKDYGGALIFVGIILIMMFMGALPIRQLAATTGVIMFLGFLVLSYANNASQRMFAFLHLEETKADTGYQVYQSLLSIANGGITGTGIGSGTSKWGYVPLAYSDFIFAVIAEELGIFGTFLVIGGFISLVYFGIQVAISSPDTHGAFIAGGVSAWFGFQALVNIGGVVGALPMTGLTLPFLSYGGSSMIASMAGAGLLLNVARHVKTN